jgi:hypothetical protein
MPAGTTHHADPDIAFGAFRILPRTDGRWAIIDERKPPGYRTVKTFGAKDKHIAIEVAKKWHEDGRG